MVVVDAKITNYHEFVSKELIFSIFNDATGHTRLEQACILYTSVGVYYQSRLTFLL